MDRLTINQLFDYAPGDHGLTEQVIYQYRPTSEENAVAVFSGSQDNETEKATVRRDAITAYGEKITVHKGPCVILTKDGSAGLMTYKAEHEEFALNHHACVLRLKSEWQTDVDLEWFVYQYQDRLVGVATSRSDNRVFSVDWFDRLVFDIPSISVQHRQRHIRYTTKVFASELVQVGGYIDQLSRTCITLKPEDIEMRGAISEFFEIHGGNSGLTEELIYHNLPSDFETSIPIRSGATLAENAMGSISHMARPHGKPLKVFDGQRILVTRKGFYAGTCTYWGGGSFAPNDDVCVMTLRKPYVGKISLAWFALQYRQTFRMAVSAKSDNATFNSDWLDRLRVEVPNLAVQERLYSLMRRCDDLKQAILVSRRAAVDLNGVSMSFRAMTECPASRL